MILCFAESVLGLVKAQIVSTYRMTFGVHIQRPYSTVSVYFHAHIKLDHRISVSTEVKLWDLHVSHVVLLYL